VAVAQVSCTSATLCLAVDPAGSAYAYDGTSWSAVSTGISLAWNADVVACGGPSFCMAGTTSGSIWTYDGTGWSESSVSVASFVANVSCSGTSAATGICMAATGDAQIVQWDAAGVAIAADGGEWVSCPSSTTCVSYYPGQPLQLWNGST
jgi:hypothetical protein